MAAPQCQLKTAGLVRENMEDVMVNSQILRFCQRDVFLTSLHIARALEFYFSLNSQKCSAMTFVIYNVFFHFPEICYKIFAPYSSSCC